jgi:hypothetical protein
LKFSIVNKTTKEKNVSFNINNVPSGYSINGIPKNGIKVSAHAKTEMTLTLSAISGSENARFLAEINDAGETLEMQLGIVNLDAPKPSGLKK